MKTLLGITLSLLCVAASAQGRFDIPNNDNLQQLAELTGFQPYALVSGGVAISGNTLVIGAPSANSLDGSAYVYTAVNGDWTNLQLTATLLQSKGQGQAGFGDAVAISGDTIVVGGYDYGALSGAAYVYINPSGNVTENAELTTFGSPSGAFNSVSTDGNTIVAGSPLAQVGSQKELGAVYVYVEPSGGWASTTQTTQLVANDESDFGDFGESVAISGSTVAVGAGGEKVDGLTGRGRAYVYVEPAGGWSGTQGQTTELEPSNGVRDGAFGASVSLSGGTVAVGASGETVGSHQEQGAVYIFSKPTTGWPKTMTETAELSAGGAGGELGSSVSLSGRTLVAGAPHLHSIQGVAFVFRAPPGGWQSGITGEAITASDGGTGNEFGLPVGIGGGVLAIGSPGWPSGGFNPSGAVYVFEESQ